MKPYWTARGANLVRNGETLAYLMRVRPVSLHDAKQLCKVIADALNMQAELAAKERDKRHTTHPPSITAPKILDEETRITTNLSSAA